MMIIMWDAHNMIHRRSTLKNKELEIGEFYDVKITRAMPFELMGTAL